jgi:hypothetical protein
VVVQEIFVELGPPPRVAQLWWLRGIFYVCSAPLLARSPHNYPAGQSNNGKERFALLPFSKLCKRQDTVPVSVGRFPNSAFEPVQESDPRPACNNIGDAQSLLDCGDPA